MNTVEAKPIKMVIVEDYKLVRVGLRSVLNDDKDINVVGEAEDGERGLELIRQLRPDVVLMDLGLPGINGIDATQRVKEFDDDIKVVILTSHESEEEVLASLGAGANAYCLKDIPSARLIEVVKAVADGAAWLDPGVARVALNLFTRSGALPTSSIRDGESIVDVLSDRELEVLKLLVDGKSNSEIAQELSVSFHTAKAHVCHILNKLSVNDRVQAAVKAVKQGLV